MDMKLYWHELIDHVQNKMSSALFALLINISTLGLWCNSLRRKHTNHTLIVLLFSRKIVQSDIITDHHIMNIQMSSSRDWLC